MVALVLWLWITTGQEWPAAVILNLVAMAHAWLTASRSPSIVHQPVYARWYGLASVVLAFAILLVALRVFAFEPFRTPAGSMYPSLRIGTIFVVKKWGYGHYSTFGVPFWRAEISAPLERGAIYAFESPKDRRYNYVKRLIGLPGDRVIYRDKRLTVNGRPLSYVAVAAEPIDEAAVSYGTGKLQLLQEEGHRIAIDPARSGQDFEATVDPGKLLFLGDNRDNSLDSRFLGQVPFELVVGKLVLLLEAEPGASMSSSPKR